MTASTEDRIARLERLVMHLVDACKPQLQEYYGNLISDDDHLAAIDTDASDIYGDGQWKTTAR